MSNLIKNGLFGRGPILRRQPHMDFVGLTLLHWNAQFETDLKLLKSLKGEDVNRQVFGFKYPEKVGSHQYVLNRLEVGSFEALVSEVKALNQEVVLVFSCIDERLHRDGLVQKHFSSQYHGKKVVILSRAGGGSLDFERNLLTIDMVKVFKESLGDLLSEVVLIAHDQTCAGVCSYVDKSMFDDPAHVQRHKTVDLLLQSEAQMKALVASSKFGAVKVTSYMAELNAPNEPYEVIFVNCSD